MLTYFSIYLMPNILVTCSTETACKCMWSQYSNSSFAGMMKSQLSSCTDHLTFVCDFEIISRAPHHGITLLFTFTREWILSDLCVLISGDAICSPCKSKV